MHNRGWIRIVEATIAILFILGTLFVINTNRAREQNAPDLNDLARDIVTEVAYNEQLRKMIITEDLAAQEELGAFVANRIPQPLQHEIRICALDDACGKSVYTEQNVYAAERLISAAIVQEQNLASKKIRLFIWR